MEASTNYGMYKSPKERANCVFQELEAEYRFIRNLHRDCADYIMPSRYQENASPESTVWEDRESKIIDGSITHSESIFEAGMSSIICNNQRPWFRLMPPDADLADYEPVKEWLQGVQEDMYSAFARSNYYNKSPINIGNCATFGIGAQSLEESVSTVVTSKTFRVGSFYIGVDDNGVVCVFARAFPMTVRQIVMKWGKYDPATGRARWELFTEKVKQAWDNSNYGTKITIRHLIEPNIEYSPKRALQGKFKRFSSKYWEAGDSDPGRFLDDSGYDFFPMLIPRWQAADERPYVFDFPGARVVGNVMQLQEGEKLGLQAQQLKVRPTMKAHPDLQGATTQVPGGIVWTESEKFIEALHKIDFDLSHHEEKQDQLRQRASKFYYEPLFARILNDQRNQRATAEEIVQGNQEQFIILAPPGSQISKDQLDPTVDITFTCLVRQGLLRRRPPPPELSGMPLTIQYLNLMGQAQKMLGTGVQERFVQFAGKVIALDPTSADAFDGIEQLREYGETLGLNPKSIRSDDKIQAIQAQRAKAEQAKQAIDNINTGSQAARNLAQTPTAGDNALAQVLGNGSPTGAPAGGF